MSLHHFVHTRSMFFVENFKTDKNNTLSENKQGIPCVNKLYISTSWMRLRGMGSKL